MPFLISDDVLAVLLSLVKSDRFKKDSTELQWALEHAHDFPAERLDELQLPNWDSVELANDPAQWPNDRSKMEEQLVVFCKYVRYHMTLNCNGVLPENLTILRVHVLRLMHQFVPYARALEESMQQAIERFEQSGDMSLLTHAWEAVPEICKMHWSQYNPATVEAKSTWAWTLYFSRQIQRPSPEAPIGYMSHLKTPLNLLRLLDDVGNRHAAEFEHVLRDGDLPMPGHPSLVLASANHALFEGRIHKLEDGARLNNAGPRVTENRQFFGTTPHPGGWVSKPKKYDGGGPIPVWAYGPEEYKKIATFDQFKGTNSGIPFSTLIRDIGQIRFWPGGRVTLNWCTWDGNKLSRRETTRLIEIDEALVPRFMCLYELRNAHLLSQLDPGEDLLPAAFELVEHEGPVYGRLVPSEKPGARILVSLTSTSVNRMGMSTGGYYAIPEIEGVVATPCGITTDSVPLDGVVSSHFVLEISLDCAPFQFSTWSLQYKKADQRWCHMENTHLRCTDR